ncbi:MAG TPA: hypothetical protein VEY89_02100 [Candidatus Dormibacteraeota bacterium]|nr:hypothetical protein [Candidatus Dormibacteraeota bacterium]
MSEVSRRLLALLLGLATVPAQAASAPVEDGLRRCAQEQDGQQRLACFDALVSTLPRIKADQFGMTAAIEQQRNPVPTAPEVLVGKISELREAGRGAWLFTLDNGQVWLQVEPQPSIRFAVGESVRIEPGAMTSLWLVADHHRKTRVKRVK